MNEQEKLLCELLNIGENLLGSGAEISRVEDTLERIGKACGAEKVHAFVITEAIVLTVSFGGQAELTQIRRIKGGQSHNFYKIDKLNALSREICSGALSPEEFYQQLESVSRHCESRKKLYVGSVLGAGSFTLFFGGSVWEAAAAAVLGCLICWMQIHIEPLWDNSTIYLFFTSLFIGVVICALAKADADLQAHNIMIGDILLLVPGIAITNAARDMLVGDNISGILRLTEALLRAAALAIGFSSAIYLGALL